MGGKGKFRGRANRGGTLKLPPSEEQRQFAAEQDQQRIQAEVNAYRSKVLGAAAHIASGSLPGSIEVGFGLPYAEHVATVDAEVVSRSIALAEALVRAAWQTVPPGFHAVPTPPAEPEEAPSE